MTTVPSHPGLPLLFPNRSTPRQPRWLSEVVVEAPAKARPSVLKPPTNVYVSLTVTVVWINQTDVSITATASGRRRYMICGALFILLFFCPFLFFFLLLWQAF